MGVFHFRGLWQTGNLFMDLGILYLFYMSSIMILYLNLALGVVLRIKHPIASGGLLPPQYSDSFWIHR